MPSKKMENDKEVYSGYLLLPPLGKILIKKSWQQKYCLLFKASKFGIERLEVHDSPDMTKTSAPRIITLENCIKITPKGISYFTVTTKTAIHEFGALDSQSRNEWLNALQSIAFPDDASKITTIEEDNDLYCSSGEGIFNVKLHSSPASERCGLEPKLYTLVLTSSVIQLRSISDNRLLFTWPYCFIRRYGCKQGKFTFEAGRKCETGEGTFYLEHSNQQEIFRCFASKLKSMKKRLNGNPTIPVLDCGDNQFQAALNMEARSRSPLPPSPTTSTTIHDIEPNLSNKSNISFADTLNNSFSMKSSLHSSQKSQRLNPTKPPRKSLQKPTDGNSNITFTSNKSKSDYEPVDKYDEVEYRSDAWRTLGVDDVSHTEVVSQDEVYLSWGGIKKIIDTIPVQSKTAPKVITNPVVSSDPDESYDKLDFFGSTSKLNSQSTYKQVYSKSVNPTPIPCPPSFNEYDEVNPVMEGVRLADDSHLGYALVRKEPNKSKLQEEPVDHQFHNNEPYAVISKPKRV